MKRYGIKLGLAMGGVFLCLALIVQALGYVTFSLTPKDPASIAKAAQFEAMMGQGGHPLDRGEIPVGEAEKNHDFKALFADVEVPERHPTGAVKVHHVEEWPVSNGRVFQEAPMLAERVKGGTLPPVSDRLPENPLVIVPPEQNGPYGGTWTRFANGPQDVGVVEARLAYEGLVRWDAMGQEVIPNLAVRWDIADGGKTYTFYLRKGIRWSDGHPLTADDLVFWYEDVLKNIDLTPVGPRDFKRGGELMGFEKIDNYTVRFTFKRPQGLFLKGLASGRGYEMMKYPAHYLKQFHPRYTDPEKLKVLANAQGFDLWTQLFLDTCDWRNTDLPRLWPWVIVQPPPARPAVFERNPYYWKVDPEGNQLPYIDKMTFEIYDAETINLKAINGEMGMQGRHLAFQNYPLFMEGRQKGDYRVVHWISGSAGDNVLAFNLNHQDPVLKKIFADDRFRKAMSLALNRQELNDADLFGIGKPRQVCPPPSSPYYDPLYEKAFTEYDPDRANQMLDDMGLTRGRDGVRLRPDGTPLSLYVETNSQNNRVLELVCGYWTAVGVHAEIKEEARQLFYQRKKGLMHDVGVWGGSDEQMPMLDPRWLIPYSDESIHGVDYARWFNTNGKRGEEPPPDMRKCIELFWQLEETPEEAGQIRLMKEILELNRKHLWVIGTLGEIPTFYLVKNSFKNVPEVAMSGWSFRTPGNTAVECYAIEE